MPLRTNPRRQRRVLTRARLVALGLLTVLIAAAALAFGPIVRGRVAREAARRHLHVEVGRVRLAWLAVRLLDVRVRFLGVDDLDVTLDEVRVEATDRLSLHEIVAQGGQVTLRGPRDAVASSLRAWRARAAPAAGSAEGRDVPMRASGLGLSWEDEGLRGEGLAISRHGRTVVVELARGEGRLRQDSTLRATVSGLRAELEGGHLERAHADALDVDGAGARLGTEIPGASGESAGPMSAHRARATALTATLARHLPEGTMLSAGALRVRSRLGAHGPFAASIVRRTDRVEITLSGARGLAASADPGAFQPVPVSLWLSLPLDPAAPVSLALAGGPVSPSLFGADTTLTPALRRLGLARLGEATLSGALTVVSRTGPAGEALAFDGDVVVKPLSIEQPRLSSEAVELAAVRLRGRGALEGLGTLRLDEATVALGEGAEAPRLTARGTVSRRGASFLADLPFELAIPSCQAVLDGLPRTLIPTAFGVRAEGTAEAHGRVTVDTKKLSDLKLDVDGKDDCRVVSVPPQLAKERFQRPFTHRVYSPKGEPREITTGPGTPGWIPYASIGKNMPVAVITTEDAGVFRKSGFRLEGLKRALAFDLEAGRFAKGGSTITQQLAKNLFLTRTKVLSRKLEEAILVHYLAQHFTKEEILELYLNIIEFGPDVYGIAKAAAFYFGKGPYGLTLPEAFALSAIVPSPTKLYAVKHTGVPELWVTSIGYLIDLARGNGLVSKEEAELAKTQGLAFR